ncbi:hypothetical protein HYPSUDRAFT_198012 [Hypholoma sublateritium FD-334 SS-4]|uniref:Uncharacterized protein n=1 Tax=Hypholoma sublateritium (strain FD-334 SS-4) TaxID=945553 RepID=A0A0D2MV44_HYPSF|nr:hypothetical protein HYPSUDRAFT_198012 [Hypholoma sublateritium FD-334 SS-4]
MRPEGRCPPFGLMSAGPRPRAKADSTPTQHASRACGHACGRAPRRPPPPELRDTVSESLVACHNAHTYAAQVPLYVVKLKGRRAAECACLHPLRPRDTKRGVTLRITRVWGGGRLYHCIHRARIGVIRTDATPLPGPAPLFSPPHQPPLRSPRFSVCHTFAVSLVCTCIFGALPPLSPWHAHRRGCGCIAERRRSWTVGNNPARRPQAVQRHALRTDLCAGKTNRAHAADRNCVGYPSARSPGGASACLRASSVASLVTAQGSSLEGALEGRGKAALAAHAETPTD